MKNLILCLFVLSCLTVFSQNKGLSEKKIILTNNAPKPIGPYSQAVLVNNTLYVSGQVAIDPVTNKLDTSNIENETKKVLDNIKAILAEAKMEFGNIVKTTIYITDMNNFSKINDVYKQYFKEAPPARETVQVAKLPKNAHIEISVIASK